MKKILLLTILGAGLFSQAYSQSTSPRFGTTASGDNTGRVLTYGKVALTDAAGADSAALNPNAWHTIYVITLTDSFTLKQPLVTRSYLGDNITIIATAASGTPFLKFTGNKWISKGTATLSTGLRAVLNFVFDGAKWVEASRTVH